MNASRRVVKGIGAVVAGVPPTQTFNKKLRYREEHSASVVLSWCTL